MRLYSRHIVVALLLVNYMLLGVVGHLEALTVSGFGTDPQHLLATKGGPPPTAKAYWTQHKHIPATVKVSIPSPAVIVQPIVSHRLQIHRLVFTPDFIHIYQSPIISLHSPRAPPQA